jgi:hypothetical protein
METQSVPHIIGGAITGLVIGGLLIQTTNIDAGTADIIEVISCCSAAVVASLLGIALKAEPWHRTRNRSAQGLFLVISLYWGLWLRLSAHFFNSSYLTGDYFSCRLEECCLS